MAADDLFITKFVSYWSDPGRTGTWRRTNSMLMFVSNWCDPGGTSTCAGRILNLQSREGSA